MSGTKVEAVVQRNGELVNESVTLQSLEEYEVLVKVHAAAFNPTDGQSFAGKVFDDGAVLGCDFAGIVEEIGPKATKYKKGDKIAALVWGGEVTGKGAYASHCVADERISYPIPKELSFAEAATIPLAANTAYLALFSEDCLKLNRDSNTKQSVLIWGGSSAVGSFSIQLAKYYGIEVVTTCSPRNFDAVKKLGAKHVFDYNDSEVVNKIQSAVPHLDHVFDTIGGENSSGISGKACGDNNGLLCTVRPGKANTDDVPKNVKVTDVFVFNAFLKEHDYGGLAHWPVKPEHHDKSAQFYSDLPKLIEDGHIRPHPVKDLGKLSPEKVREAMQLVKDGKVSNNKLTFQVS